MRSGWPRHTEVPFVVDMTIALALCATVTFFIVVMEFCVGQGELTHAELLLLGSRAHSANPSTTKKQQPGNSSWKND
jgi:hypothetical protein